MLPQKACASSPGQRIRAHCLIFVWLQFLPCSGCFLFPSMLSVVSFYCCGIIPVLTQNNLRIFFIPTFVILFTLLLQSFTHSFTSFHIKLKAFLFHSPYQFSTFFPLISFYFCQIPTSCIFHLFCLCSSASKTLFVLVSNLKTIHTLQSAY